MANFLKLVFFALLLLGAFLTFKFKDEFVNGENSGALGGGFERKRELVKTQDLKPLACDLNQRACEYEFKGRSVRAEFKNKPLRILDENELVIENLGSFKRLNARIYALNMYMGDVVPEFKALGDENNQTYSANIVISACPLDLMRYRIELFDGDTPLNLHFDVDIRR